MNCYTCGKEDLETPFCSEECHQKWIESHYPIKKKLNLAEMQKEILSWRKNPHYENVSFF